MSALGDIVHALPVLAAVREVYPSIEVDWLADRAHAGVLDLVEGIANRVVVRPGYARAVQFTRSRDGLLGGLSQHRCERLRTTSLR